MGCAMPHVRPPTGAPTCAVAHPTSHPGTSVPSHHAPVPPPTPSPTFLEVSRMKPGTVSSFCTGMMASCDCAQAGGDGGERGEEEGRCGAGGSEWRGWVETWLFMRGCASTACIAWQSRAGTAMPRAGAAHGDRASVRWPGVATNMVGTRAAAAERPRAQARCRLGLQLCAEPGLCGMSTCMAMLAMRPAPGGQQHNRPSQGGKRSL